MIQVGGISEAVKIAHYAQMRHLDFTIKNYSTAISLGASLQVLYALPNGDYFECDQDPCPWRADIVTQAVYTMDDGMVTPTDRPGLGVEVDEAALETWRIAP